MESFVVMNQLCVKNPGKGEVSHVTALHVKTESIGSRRQNLQRSIGLLQARLGHRTMSPAISQIS